MRNLRGCLVASAAVMLLESGLAQATKGGCADDPEFEANVRALLAGKKSGSRKWAGSAPLTCIAASTALSDETKVAAARILLEHGADPNAMDENSGSTALHSAASTDAPGLATLLIEAGADPDAIDLSGVSPVQLAMKSSDPAVVEVFAARGRYLDNRDNSGSTALFDAARRGDLATVRQLVTHGADAGASDRNALTGAALGGHEAVVRYLVQEANLSVDVRSSDGETALMAAAAANHLPMARMLVEELRADPELASPRGFTALSLAATAGHVDMLRYLLAHGATHGASRPTAVSAAALARRPAAVAALLDSGADIGPGSPEQPGVLFWAGVSGNDEILRMLVDRGAAMPMFPSDVGPLVRAVVNRHYARGLLAQERYAEALPHLREAVAGYDSVSAALTMRAAELNKVANREELKADLFSAFAAAFGQFAAAYHQQQTLDTVAQAAALRHADRTGTGAAGYLAYYDRLQSVPGPSTANIDPPVQGAGSTRWMDTAVASRAEADALTKAAAQYSSDSKSAATMLDCATAAAGQAGTPPAGRCL